ncbi:hypothetical protein [Clostridium beijerinckii]|uniref:Uncharacterized protein n=1 Tax=Clostridium beijerinckii TaxID=1520 RepID=A0AAX0B151_CLOBE|nr:hypothetical protein [Clostridium beijerinckii]NRT88912.1 hypothetical protein [Clostridium beijerinckii]NYC74367.1 hypothetical protein [Clostridium beijerinckii]
MTEDVYKNINIAAKNIGAVLKETNFNIEEKKDLIATAARMILDNLKLI